MRMCAKILMCLWTFNPNNIGMSVFFTCFVGSRLQILKEQLQKQMKVKRAEVRKIQESQRKLDNEEMSEEEEEEMTDEEGVT